VKFYTNEGNFDIVGNNIPVFFIQDAIKFPDIIHAAKPEPDTEVPQASTAHTNFWDFISLQSETSHMVMWVMSDRAIPRSLRMMQGFGVHTFVLTNKKGKNTFVKFHFIPKLGVHSLVWDEAQKISGVDPDFHRRDLSEAIDAGHFPEWDLYIQQIEESDENKFDFDILDATKLIPEELAPLRKIGRIVLDRNPDNFFAEVEQVAYHTGHLVPGISPSNDPLLQGRLFSYLDTQLTRLGGPNFEEIPINRPHCPFKNNQQDSFHRMTINKEKVNYFPNRFGKPAPGESQKTGNTYSHPHTPIHGEKIRARGPKFAEHFKQATMFYNSLSGWEREHVQKALTFELSKVMDQGVKDRMITSILSHIDYDLAHNVAQAIGAQLPAQAKVPSVKGSPALSQTYYKSDSIETRKVAFLIAEGFSDHQANYLRSSVTKAGAVPVFIGPSLGKINSDKEGHPITPDATFTNTKSVLYDAVVIVGGKEHMKSLSQQGETTAFVLEAFKHAKPIIATTEGVDFVARLNLPDVKLSTDGSLASYKGVVSSGSFSHPDHIWKAMFDAIKAHRHYDRDVSTVPI
jgi:catalase